jgi:hypothetical protein
LAKLGQIVRYSTGDDVSVPHRWYIHEFGPCVHQVVSHSGVAGGPLAPYDPRRDQNPGAMADGSQELAPSVTLKYKIERPFMQPQGIGGIPAGKEQAVNPIGAEFLNAAHFVSVALLHNGYRDRVAETARDGLLFNLWTGMESLTHRYHHDFSPFLAEPQHWIKKLDVFELVGNDDGYRLA